MLEVSFNLPQSTLEPGTAEQVATIVVAQGQELELRWLSLHLIRLDLSNTSLPIKINKSMGTAYAGLVGDRAAFLTSPTGRPLVYVPVELPGVAANSPAFITQVNPGTYSLIVVNNLSTNDIEVSCCGTFRITLPT